MLYYKQIIIMLVCCGYLTLKTVDAFPEFQISLTDLSSDKSDSEFPSAKAETEAIERIENVYRYGQTLRRLKRAIEELAEDETAADDMELAEFIHFRPLFRYRTEIEKRVNNPRRRFG